MPIGLHPDLLFGVTRIRAEFRDDVGNKDAGTGTAFWAKTIEGHCVLTTNKHVLDPRMTLGPKTESRLVKLLVELRLVIAGRAYEKTEFVEVANLSSALFTAETADCALVVAPRWKNLRPNYEPCVFFAEANLATPAQFDQRISAMDTVFFIGFPGSEEDPWWDLEWSLPIARSAVIASWARTPYHNKYVRTTDTMLVTGFSFGGSSGSPVVLQPKGLAPGSDILDPNFVPALLLGIMSGHIQEKEQPAMFRHSGLSYLTRSTSIASLVALARANNFQAPTPDSVLLQEANL